MVEHLVYEILVKSLEKEVNQTYTIDKAKHEDMLGIDFTTEPVPVTKDGKILLPAFMIAKFKDDSVAQRAGLRIGSVITGINGSPVTVNGYHGEIVKHKSFSLNVNESFCELYQFLISEPTISNRITFHQNNLL